MSVLDKFQHDLGLLTPPQIVYKHILSGDCFALTLQNYVLLKEAISEFFGVSSAEVLVVGSAKLGFSLNPGNSFSLFDEDTSDIDVAVVSSLAFDKVWKEIHRYDVSGTDWTRRGDFRKYLYNGWIRPDMMPRNDTLPYTTEWQEFFIELRKSANYGGLKINAGLYKDWYFLQRYQENSVKECKLAMEGNS